MSRRTRRTLEVAEARVVGLARRALPRPRVGLVGFFGWGNFGDELFLDAYRQHLGDAVDLRVLHDVLASPYYSGDVVAAVDAVDAVVIGGGDLVVPWRLSGLYWKEEYLRRPVYVCGVGVPDGYEPRPGVVARLRQFFQHPNVRWVSARDAESVAWIERHLAPAAPVRLTSDVVWALDVPPAQQQPDLVGIATRATRAGERSYPHVAEVARAALARGLRVRQLVLGTGQVAEQDAVDAARLGVEGTEVVRADDQSELCRAIGECRLVLSMKFHGTLVAARYGTAAVSMATSSKTVRMLDRLGRPDLVAPWNSEDLVRVLDRWPDPVAPEAVAPRVAEATATLAELRHQLVPAPALAPTGGRR